MNKLLNNIKISTRATFSVMFFIATLGFTTYNAYSSIGLNVDFATQEKLGNYYQRPLSQLLYHTSLLKAALADNRDGNKAAIDGLVNNITNDIEDLKKVQDVAGESLQFTDEGLSSRGRENLEYDKVLAKWRNLKGEIGSVDLVKTQSDLASFIADIRGMIAHSGDTSNLILDPDLDSYYLMDVTLLALPQTVGRLGDIGEQVTPLLLSPLEIGKNEQIKFSTMASMLTESDVGRIVADFDTSFKEDPNFYGVSPSYNKSIAPLLEAYQRTNQDLALKLDKLSKGEIVTPQDFRAALKSAIDSANSLWSESFDELDILIQLRIDAYRQQQLVSLGMSALGIMLSLTFYIIVVLSIVRPLNELTRIMIRVAENDLSNEVPYKNSSSEIGSIAKALEVFKNNRIKTVQLEEAGKIEALRKEQRQKKVETLISSFDTTATQTRIDCRIGLYRAFADRRRHG